VRSQLGHRPSERIDGRRGNRSAGVVCASMHRDPSFDQITADDLGRDANDHVVAPLNRRDLLVEASRAPISLMSQ
jgi:hypothetical protein